MQVTHHIVKAERIERERANCAVRSSSQPSQLALLLPMSFPHGYAAWVQKTEQQKLYLWMGVIMLILTALAVLHREGVL